ncbi:MAG: patatin-like phospholipase family protein [candidate division WOR-3 bacterium]
MRRFFVLILFFGFVFAEPVRIGLALSGGAALGLAHIGVLKVLEKEGLDFVGIAGNSMGSLVGGVYAAGYQAAVIESIALSADWNRLFSSGSNFGAKYLQEKQQAERYVLQLRHKNFLPYLPSGLVPLQNVEMLLNRLLAEIEFNTGYDFDSLVIPYRAVAVDINKGELLVLKNGRLEQAIRASIAIPGVFSPEKIGGRELVDGGVMEYLPVAPLKDFTPDFVIAVLTMRRQESGAMGLIDIASRSLDLMGLSGVERSKVMADVVIEPDVSKFLHSDFAKARELIAAGESAAVRALPLIREKLKGRVPVRVRKRIEKRGLPFVREVRFEGLKRTRRSLVLPYVRTKEKSRLSFAILFDDIERLFNTGLFEDVNFRFEFVNKESVDVVFEVSERPFGFYAIGLRYDNYDNVVLGLEVGEENILGSGATVRAAGVIGNPYEFRLGITGTRIFQLPFGYRLDGYARSQTRSLWNDGRFSSNYIVDFWGGVGEAGYILGRNGFFNFGLKAERVGYDGSAVDTVSDEWVGLALFNLEFNNQERLDLPARGFAYRLSGSYSTPRVLSKREFLKVEFNCEQILPVWQRFGWRWWLNGGLSFGSLPLSDYFLSGGERFLGFAQEEFATEERLILGSALRFKVLNLLNSDDYPVYLELIGNGATFERPDLLIKGEDIFSRLHWGAGFGVVTNTPLGPLRFTVSSGNFLKKAPHPGGLRFYLSLGKEFRYRH